jgi:hypothetical protein
MMNSLWKMIEDTINAHLIRSAHLFGAAFGVRPAAREPVFIAAIATQAVFQHYVEATHEANYLSKSNHHDLVTKTLRSRYTKMMFCYLEVLDGRAHSLRRG